MSDQPATDAPPTDPLLPDDDTVGENGQAGTYSLRVTLTAPDAEDGSVALDEWEIEADSDDEAAIAAIGVLAEEYGGGGEEMGMPMPGMEGMPEPGGGAPMPGGAPAPMPGGGAPPGPGPGTSHR